jgi:DNA repair exonuclease SbcCD ATPase subunit
MKVKKMIPSNYTLKNSVLITRFEDLQAQGRNPHLGVYRGKDLMIISYHANGLLEKISSIFTAAIINLYKLFNLLSTDSLAIEELRNDVYNFHLSRVQGAYQEEFQRLQEAVRQITQENETLNQSKNQLLSEISNLGEQKQAVGQEKGRVEADFQTIRQDYLLARSAIQQKEAVEQETIRLENDLASLRRKKNALLPAQNELADLQRQISALNAERNNIEGRSQINENQALKSIIRDREDRLYRIRLLANNASSHNPKNSLSEILRLTYP